VYQCLKIISVPGSEKIIRYAFEYARQNNRKKVTCFAKDNIMKLTDGVFHKIFNEIATEYPELENEFWIVDIGAAKLADTPQHFDVVVMPNLYGDILSDVAAQIAGSVGLAGSANIGDQCAMFEAIHGSAPRRAGQNLANPSGLLMGAVMMLVHIGQGDVATRVHNAWLKTLEDGIHTYDIFSEQHSKQQVGTNEFAEAVVARLGQKPEILKPVEYKAEETGAVKKIELKKRPRAKKELVGVDVFIDEHEPNAEALAKKLQPLTTEGLKMLMMTNRGVKVWPGGFAETFCSDHWRVRYMGPEGDEKPITHADISRLLARFSEHGVDYIKTENLYTFDGQAGYSLGQGE